MDQDRQFGDRPLVEGARMVAVAIASAALTASLVILIGQTLIDPVPPRPEPALVRTSG
ncbi:MAG: hypothetical protein Q8S03_01605 [Brevundimonas sp.]|uniref:hypothetical protein n=1 Tax=Brevundimonas sp. TaxID=1871086 RepID=UPI0027360A73|nr:hypothetical protein [Brevundimonas sp.]MDP3403352.1 hypothetical protein [Brevundimonas sp.]